MLKGTIPLLHKHNKRECSDSGGVGGTIGLLF